MLYGTYRNRKFADIFPAYEDFETAYQSSGIPDLLNGENTLSTIYYLLLSRYANSTVASSDENRFKLAVAATIFQYGPTWEKRIEIQSKLRNLTDAEIMDGAKAINNHAYNPSTEPTSADDELKQLNEQTITRYKKSKIEAYSVLINLLEVDVTERFLEKFKKLFTIFMPEQPILYESTEEEENA